MPIAAPDPRLTMLETIREFSLAELQTSGEEATIRQRHALWFRQFAESRIPEYDGPGLRIAMDRIQIEFDNLRTAFAWFTGQHQWEEATRLAGSLWRNWRYGPDPALSTGIPSDPSEIRPHLRFTEGHHWLRLVLSREHEFPVTSLTEALTGASQYEWYWGNADAGRAYGEELLQRATAGDYPYGIVWACYTLGHLALMSGDIESATHYYTQAHQIAPLAPKSEGLLSMTNGGLGIVHQLKGNLQQAAEHYRQALALTFVTQNPFGIAQASIVVASIEQDLGNLSQAFQNVTRAINILSGEWEPQSLSGALIQAASLAAACNLPGSAIRLLAAAEWRTAEPSVLRRIESDLATIREHMPAGDFAQAYAAGRELDSTRIAQELDIIRASLDAPSTNSDPANSHNLTQRERQVLILLAEGKTNRAIADHLSLSERTIESHVLNLRNKLGLDSRTAAATYAVCHNLIPT